MLARLKVDSRIRAGTASLTEIMVYGKICSGVFEYVSRSEANLRISMRLRIKRNRRIERALRLLYIIVSVQEFH